MMLVESIKLAIMPLLTPAKMICDINEDALVQTSCSAHMWRAGLCAYVEGNGVM